MRVVIATLDDGEGVRALALAWHRAALPAERLHVVADVRAAPLAGTDVPLVHVATHERWSLWLLAWPVGGRSPGDRRSRPDRRERRRRRRGLALLGRLIVAGESAGWPTHAEALARGRRLGVVRLGRDGDDALALVRPLLAATSSPVRIRDL